MSTPACSHNNQPCIKIYYEQIQAQAVSFMNSCRGSNASTLMGFKSVEDVCRSSIECHREGSKSGDPLSDSIEKRAPIINSGAAGEDVGALSNSPTQIDLLTAIVSRDTGCTKHRPQMYWPWTMTVWGHACRIPSSVTTLRE